MHFVLQNPSRRGRLSFQRRHHHELFSQSCADLVSSPRSGRFPKLHGTISNELPTDFPKQSIKLNGLIIRTYWTHVHRYQRIITRPKDSRAWPWIFNLHIRTALQPHSVCLGTPGLCTCQRRGPHQQGYMEPHFPCVRLQKFQNRTDMDPCNDRFPCGRDARIAGST